MPFKMYVDTDGIPYSDYGEYKGVYIGRQKSILAVAERGLYYWNEYLKEQDAAILLSYDWNHWPINYDEFRPADNDEALRMLLNCAHWLKGALKIYNNFSVWEYPYPFSYQTGPGWRSAHAQAVSLQLLIRAQELTGDDTFIEDLDHCLTAFQVDIKEGGLSTLTDSGNIWFEKMADQGNQKPKVLNGLLFALLGLRDIADRTGNDLAQNLCNHGIDAAIELLPKFDLGDWSSYDIHGKRASLHYHTIHVEQLNILSKAHPTFKLFHKRFNSYSKQQKDTALTATLRNFFLNLLYPIG